MRIAWVVVAAMCGLTACVPWTVRPIGREAGGAATRVRPADYVASIWSAKVLPMVDAAPVAADPRTGTEPKLARVTGRVVRVNAEPPSATLELDLAPGDGKTDVTVAIGPVIQGSALRDALGFIRFGDFVNQIDYADVASELNRRAVAGLPAMTEMAAWRGKTVELMGACAAANCVPVRLRVAGSR